MSLSAKFFLLVVTGTIAVFFLVSIPTAEGLRCYLCNDENDAPERRSLHSAKKTGKTTNPLQTTEDDTEYINVNGTREKMGNSDYCSELNETTKNEDRNQGECEPFFKRPVCFNQLGYGRSCEDLEDEEWRDQLAPINTCDKKSCTCDKDLCNGLDLFPGHVTKAPETEKNQTSEKNVANDSTRLGVISALLGVTYVVQLYSGTSRISGV